MAAAVDFVDQPACHPAVADKLGLYIELVLVMVVWVMLQEAMRVETFLADLNLREVDQEEGQIVEYDVYYGSIGISVDQPDMDVP